MSLRGEDQATDGRKANCYLLIPGEVLTTGALSAGSWYCIKALAATSSALTAALDATATEEAIAAGAFFRCPSGGITLIEGDEVWPMTKKFMGFAKGKSLSRSKSAIDVTSDDAKSINDYICDGMVGVTGTINGFDKVSTVKDSAINILRREFSDVYIEDIANPGKLIHTPITNDKHIILFDWREMGIKEGDAYDVDIVPVILTSLENSSDYGSGKAFNLNFSGCATDEEGRIGSYQVLKYFKAA